MDTRRIILIAERFNMAMNPRLASRYAEDPARWVRVSLRLGAFRKGNGAARLRGLGLRWDASMNLLPPCPNDETGGVWDHDQARRIAEIVQSCVLSAFDAVVMVGARVPEAFGWTSSKNFAMTVIPAVAGFSEIRVGFRDEEGTTIKNPIVKNVAAYRVPHPSGLNRWWNTPENVNMAQRVISEWDLGDKS